MCGRFTLVRLSDFLDRFPWIAPPDSHLPPRYNVAPSQPVAVVTNAQEKKVDFYRWGLVPAWAKDLSIGNRMINARAEALASKPAFSRLLKRHRCLVPADGFYEWRKVSDGKKQIKTPMYIRMKDRRPFAFAGLWDTWRDPSGTTVPSCTIITTTPNELMQSIHDRMPVIVRAEDYARWLAAGAADVGDVLASYPAELMEAYVVSSAVNSPSVDSPHNIDPVVTEQGAEPTKLSGQGRLFPGND
jgi:putative SOS response-associated peptidase YedK